MVTIRPTSSQIFVLSPLSLSFLPVGLSLSPGGFCKLFECPNTSLTIHDSATLMKIKNNGFVIPKTILIDHDIPRRQQLTLSPLNEGAWDPVVGRWTHSHKIVVSLPVLVSIRFKLLQSNQLAIVSKAATD